MPTTANDPKIKLKNFLNPTEKAKFKKIWTKVTMDIGQFQSTQSGDQELEQICGNCFTELASAIENITDAFPNTMLLNKAIDEVIPNSTKSLITCLETLIQNDQHAAHQENYKNALTFITQLQMCCSGKA